ncbi:permease (plasmid) [Pseudoalteromonas sp. T1lg65]|uniref:permease n=1 Tax=Pseudoalteromonas sp. T1lg65 TaxID=2077101 RepID=UPI003F79F23C
MKQSSDCCHKEKPNKKDSQERTSERVDLLFWGALSVVTTLMLGEQFFSSQLSDFIWLSKLTQSTHHMLGEIWWGVAIGMVFIGLLSHIPRQFVTSALGKGGTFSGLLRATAAGVLLDLCSHGILMIGAKLYERGASAGQVIAFLLASPWNSFSFTLVLIGLIGVQWTLVYIVLSMLVAITTGWMFDLLVKRDVLPANKVTDAAQEFKFWDEARSQLKSVEMNVSLFTNIVKRGLIDSKMVVRWLLIGVLIAALLQASLDESTFQQYFGPTLLGLSMTVFVATVLEVCSEGSAPIAADIVERGQAPGNGFAFLMAGVATDYTEVMILKETTNSWKLALFLPLISVPQILLLAFILNS